MMIIRRLPQVSQLQQPMGLMAMFTKLSPETLSALCSSSTEHRMNVFCIALNWSASWIMCGRWNNFLASKATGCFRVTATLTLKAWLSETTANLFGLKEAGADIIYWG